MIRRDRKNVKHNRKPAVTAPQGSIAETILQLAKVRYSVDG
jgi:hypothetical protein